MFLVPLKTLPLCFLKFSFLSFCVFSISVVFYSTSVLCYVLSQRFLYAGAFDLSGPPYKCAFMDNSQLWPQDGSDIKDG